MKKVSLCTSLFLFAFSIYSQTVEVIVTDTVMCTIESYECELTVNIPRNSRTLKRKELQNVLNSGSYTYEDFYGEPFEEERDGYSVIKHRLIFESAEEENEFILQMKLKRLNYSLNIIEFRIQYNEKEKKRLWEKILIKGKQEAKLIVDGLGKELAGVKHVSDVVDSRLRASYPENLLPGNYGYQKEKETNNKDQIEKIKSYIITFDTK